MEKLTLSIKDKEKIKWAKSFAKEKNTNVSRLFESFLESLMSFEQKEVILSKNLQNLRQPGSRPNQKQIENHLNKRRNRQTTK
ncbi:DUF6364 family protein [Cyclobacterium roseum]|uniref:DUF6364 family protein n=1 Tax=Cyclobacterium roseum TaxID=2666137 RepID=UPI0013907C9A|nr:DUF6364 family protein [Cyclobacterium roseum]